MPEKGIKTTLTLFITQKHVATAVNKRASRLLGNTHMPEHVSETNKALIYRSSVCYEASFLLVPGPHMTTPHAL